MEGKKAGASLIIRPTDAVTMPQNVGHARCLINIILKRYVFIDDSKTCNQLKLQ